MPDPDDAALRQRLCEGIASLQLTIGEEAVNGLLHYVRQLHRWNRAFNLTAVRDLEAMVDRHLLDSLSIMPWVGGSRVLDMGTGPGLPGIPLALARPDWQVDLLDSNGKKIRFLIQQIAELGLRSEAIQQRVEAYRPAQLYHTVVSRALAPLAQLAEWAEPLLVPGGQLVAMKSVRLAEELSALPKRFNVVACVDLTVPGVEGVRNAVVLSVAESNRE